MNLWNKYIRSSFQSSQSKQNDSKSKNELIKSPTSASLISDQQEALYQLNESFQRENRSTFSLFGTSNHEKNQNKKANSILHQLSNSSSSKSIRNEYSQLQHSDYLSPDRNSTKIRVDVFEDSESDGEVELDEERQNSFTTLNTSLDESLSLDLNLINNQQTKVSSNSFAPSPAVKQVLTKRPAVLKADPVLPSSISVKQDLHNTNSVLINRMEFDLLLRKKLKDCQKKQLQQQLHSSTSPSSSSPQLASSSFNGYQPLTISSPQQIQSTSPAPAAAAVTLSPWQSSPPPVPRLNQNEKHHHETRDIFFIFHCPEGINRTPFTPVSLSIQPRSISKSSHGLAGFSSIFSPTTAAPHQKETKNSSFSIFSGKTYQQSLLCSPSKSHSNNHSNLSYSYRSPSSSSSFYSHGPSTTTTAAGTTTTTIGTGGRRVLKRSLEESCEYSPTPANSPKDNSRHTSHHSHEHGHNEEEGPFLKAPKK